MFAENKIGNAVSSGHVHGDRGCAHETSTVGTKHTWQLPRTTASWCVHLVFPGPALHAENAPLDLVRPQGVRGAVSACAGLAVMLQINDTHCKNAIRTLCETIIFFN